MQCRRRGFHPWIKKTPWRREWLPTPVFLPGKSHGQRSLAGYSPRGHKRVGHNLATKHKDTLTANGPYGSAGKESAHNAGDLGSIPGLGRSPREGKGYALQCFSLENSMDCIVPGVTKSQTWLSDIHFLVSEIYRLISIVFACIYMCVTCLHVCVSWIICENWNVSDVYIF